MKHKTGNLVQIRSKEWFDGLKKNSLGNGEIPGGGIVFNKEMVQYCGKLTRIRKTSVRNYEVFIDFNRWVWADEFFEEPGIIL